MWHNIADGKITQSQSELPGSIGSVSNPAGMGRDWLASQGWLEETQEAAPVDAVAVSWELVVEADKQRVRKSVVSYKTQSQVEAEIEAAAKNAEDAAKKLAEERLAALVAAYGGLVGVLQKYLSAVGWSIPCDSSLVIADVTGRDALGKLTPEQQLIAAKLGNLYLILRGAGVSNTDIEAVWAKAKP